MLTISAIAKRYDLPESTVRFYCKRFLAYLPHAGLGKRRRYNPEALDVFDAILAEMKNSKNASAVEAAIAARFPKAPLNNDAGSAMRPSEGFAQRRECCDAASLKPLLENQIDALRQIAGVLGRVVAFQDRIESVAFRVGGIEAKLDEYNTSLMRFKKIQDDTEQIHQQDIEILRKWLAHLAKELKEKNV
jgi:DNA-binding transcriptional MerR regulator